MAHEISIQNIGGVKVVEAMYANKPAWHNLGEVFDLGGETGPDGDTALRLAHLDWQVDKETFALTKDGKGTTKWYATVRQDTREILGIVGKDYKVHQNEEGFNFVDSLVKDGIMRYESAFALHGGSETVLLARFPQVDTIAEGDHSLRYMAWMNSHDGSSNIIGMPTSVRIVCANTKRLALSRDGKLAIRIRHSANMTQTLALASLKLSQYNAGFDLFRDQAQLLATRLVTRDTQIEYLNTLSPEPAKKSEDTNGKTWTNWQKTRNQIMAALRQPAQNLPAIQGTWWALFNAVTAATDHNGTYQGTERAKSESRFMTLVDGPKSIFKDKAFDLACEMASVSLNNAA